MTEFIELFSARRNDQDYILNLTAAVLPTRMAGCFIGCIAWRRAAHAVIELAEEHFGYDFRPDQWLWCVDVIAERIYLDESNEWFTATEIERRRMMEADQECNT